LQGELRVKTILIVDDSRTTRNYHAAIVASGGYEVLTASDGAQGLEILLMHSCHLVLTDINMAGMDGYEFIRRIRVSAGHETVPVVIISTESQSKDKSSGYLAGANLYIVKPSEPNVLLGYVKLMIGEAS
jgi:two-component system chemotaxis response regulator CheY